MAVTIMWAVATIVFLAMRLVPSDPAMVVLGDHATAEALEAFREKMGLNRPLTVQYWEFISRLARGELGIEEFNTSFLEFCDEFLPPVRVTTCAKKAVCNLSHGIYSLCMKWGCRYCLYYTKCGDGCQCWLFCVY